MATIIGTSGDDIDVNQFTGTPQADLIQLLAGNDITRPGRGADTVDGGAGIDMVSYADSIVGVRVDLLSNTGTGGFADGDTYIDIENVFGSNQNDVLLGNGGVNRLSGGANNDTLFGRGGNDTLFGGQGNDRLDGGAGDDAMVGETGNDFYVVNSTGDQVFEFAGNGIDTVQVFLGNYTLDANVERGVLGVAGGQRDSNIVGNTLSNFLRGNAGDNRIEGRIGADTIQGRDGNDVIEGQRGFDQIFGGTGNDVIAGGLGKDVINGGPGADTFIYRSVLDSRAGPALRDRINDFDTNDDTFDLSLIDANSGASGNQAFTLVNEAAFSGTAGELRINVEASNNRFIIEGDVDGDGNADFQVVAANTTNWGADDFIL